MSYDPEIAPESAVARFDIYCRSLVDVRAGGVRESHSHVSSAAVFPSDNFFIGRSHESRGGKISDVGVSARHLKVHSVLYEADTGQRLPPLVYVRDNSTSGTRLVKHGETVAHRIRKSESPALLGDGDVLHLGNNTTCIFRVTDGDGLPVGLSAQQLAESRTFNDRYQIITGQMLGSGGHGSVFAAIHFRSRVQLACKVVPIVERYAKLRNDYIHDNVGFLEGTIYHRELQVLRGLNHPNVIGLQKVFWSESNLYIFQELLTGGDLFSFFAARNQRLLAAEAGLVIFQILKGLEYLHSKGIVHRDLKLENVLMAAPEPTARIVLADFGSSRNLPRTKSGLTSMSTRMFTKIGTIDYQAPDMYIKSGTADSDEGYSSAVDMWSLGVISYMLIFGLNPFVDPTLEGAQYRAAVMVRATRLDISQVMERSQDRAVGSRPRDFIKNLLVLDGNKRMTAKSAIAHDWFTNERNAGNFQRLYQQAIQSWKPRSKKLKILEHIELLDGSHDTTRHLKQGPVAFRQVQALARPRECQSESRLPNPELNSGEIPKTPDWGYADDMVETSDALDVGFALDGAVIPGSDQAPTTALSTINGTADDRIRQRLHDMSLDWDAIRESVPAPNESELMDLDSVAVESSSSVFVFQGPAVTSTAQSNAAKWNKCVNAAKNSYAQGDLGYRVVKRRDWATGLPNDLGDGFEAQELQKHPKFWGHNTSKRARLW